MFPILEFEYRGRNFYEFLFTTFILASLFDALTAILGKWVRYAIIFILDLVLRTQAYTPSKYKLFFY